MESGFQDFECHLAWFHTNWRNHSIISLIENIEIRFFFNFSSIILFSLLVPVSDSLYTSLPHKYTHSHLCLSIKAGSLIDTKFNRFKKRNVFLSISFVYLFFKYLGFWIYFLPAKLTFLYSSVSCLNHSNQFSGGILYIKRQIFNGWCLRHLHIKYINSRSDC